MPDSCLYEGLTNISTDPVHSLPQFSFFGILSSSPHPTLTLEHASVGSLGHCVHVGRHFVALLAPVHLHDGLRVDGQLLVWVDDHTEKAGVRLQWARRERASASYLPVT